MCSICASTWTDPTVTVYLSGRPRTFLTSARAGLAAKQMTYRRVPRRSGAMVAEFLQYETFVISARDSSHKYTPQGVQLLSSESATTATGGQGRTDRHQQNFQCEYPLTSRPGAGSCDEPATKLKLGVVGSEAKLGRARTTPAAGAGERSTQREPWEAASSPPCRAAPTTAAAGCRATVGHHVQEGAARAQAGGRRCRAASCCRPTSRAQSCPPAQPERPGRRTAPPRP